MLLAATSPPLEVTFSHMIFVVPNTTTEKALAAALAGASIHEDMAKAVKSLETLQRGQDLRVKVLRSA